MLLLLLFFNEKCIIQPVLILICTYLFHILNFNRLNFKLIIFTKKLFYYKLLCMFGQTKFIIITKRIRIFQTITTTYVGEVEREHKRMNLLKIKIKEKAKRY